jgi:predicted nucleotide-binding protein
LDAKNRIGTWGQTTITDLLLEAGVKGLSAPATSSPQDRANAILSYVFEHPSITTADGSLFSAFLVRKAGIAREPDLAEGISTRPEHSRAAAARSADKRASNRVFVVHGRDNAARASVVELLTQYGLQAIVLNEQPNMGRHLLTKFIQEAALTTFAVVLLTADDIGGKVDEMMSPRARQNVILELGYFIAFLGQERVCALKTPGTETPSDFDGIGYIAMDETGDWKKELYRELVAAKLPLSTR